MISDPPDPTTAAPQPSGRGRNASAADAARTPLASWRRAVLLLLTWLLLALGAAAPGRAAEGSAAPPPLRVVADENYPPYLYRDADGQLRGIVRDLWALWEERSGRRVQLEGLPWAEAQRRLLAGEADVIDTIFRTPGREPLYEFTSPYAELSGAIFAHRSITGIAAPQDLRGFLVGVQDGDACVEMLRTAGIVNLGVYRSYGEVIEAAAQGQVKLFCMDDRPAAFFLYRHGLHEDFPRLFELYRQGFRRAVRRGEGALLREVEQGFARITAAEAAAIEARWVPAAPAPPLLAPGVQRWILLGLAGTAALAALWAVSVRRTIRRRTAELRTAERDLRERIKEQACLHEVFRATEDLDRPLAEVLQEVVHVLPAGWMHVDVAVARIAWQDLCVTVGDWTAPAATLGAAIVSADGTTGRVEVAYTAERPPADEGPFLREERALLDSVAARIASIVRRREEHGRLIESEERFRRLFEESSQPALILAHDGIVAANAAAVAALGREAASSLEGRSLLEFTPPFQPDARPSAPTLEALEHEAEERGQVDFEWELRGAAGQPLHVRALCSRARWNGREVHHLVWTDVTAWKRAERELDDYRIGLERLVTERTAELAAATASLRTANGELQAILDGTSAGIMLTRNRVIERCNRRLEEIMGYGPGELDSRPTAVLYTDTQSWQQAGEAIGEAIAAGRMFVRETMARRKDGSTLWVRLTARPLDPSDPDKGLVGMVDDISLARKAMDDLQHAKVLAEDAARTKSSFLANVSHEIRTPLNAIVNLTYLVARTPLDAQQRDYIDKIERASRSLLGIVNDILDFARIDTGRVAVTLVEFDVDDVVAGAADLIAPRCAAKGIGLAVDVDASLPRPLRGDPMNIGKALAHFADNAVKFTEHGRIVVRARMEQDLGDRVVVRLEVEDTGIGISEAEQRRLFRDFEQADSSTTRRYGGTGLGLAISRGLAVLLGGEVGVDSRPGQGSRFWLRLALERSATAAPAPKAGSGAGVRVLVETAGAPARASEPAGSAAPEVLADGCRQLLALLDEGDPRVTAWLRAQTPVLSQAFGPQFPSIAQAVHDFDYGRAHALLRAAMDQRGIG